jgi:hypothetical protein
MKDRISLVVGFAAGAIAMYYLDPRGGRRRRALVRDKLVAAGHDAVCLAGAKRKRAIDHLKGWLVTRRFDRHTRKLPESDQQLHDRIRSRLGRVMSHPRSVDVHVENGRVHLGGHIFTRELDHLLSEVRHMPGVKSVEHELACHDSAAGIPELQGRTIMPPGRGQRRGEPAFHSGAAGTLPHR